MNFTKEEIEEIKEALEARECLLNRIVNGADIRATESARKHMEMMH